MDRAIRVATQAELEDVAAVLDLGFSSDPTTRWALPDAARFLRGHRDYALTVCRPAMAAGTVFICGDMAGVSVWYPPGVKADYEDFLIRAAREVDPARLETFLKLLAACEKLRPKGDSWSLELLSVDPAARGQGIGAALMEHGLRHCDALGQPVYLESSNPRNLTLYRRFGFELLREVRLADAPPRFPMFRKVGPVSSRH